MCAQSRRNRPASPPESGQALAEYLLVLLPVILAALGVTILFREAWSALFGRFLILLGPWP